MFVSSSVAGYNDIIILLVGDKGCMEKQVNFSLGIMNHAMANLLESFDIYITLDAPGIYVNCEDTICDNNSGFKSKEGVIF